MREDKPLTAIKIDPDACTVELIHVQPEEVAGVIGSTLMGSMDFEDGHCLVFDDGSAVTDHPARFHLADDALQRPYFGTVLIVGLANGNWSSVTMEVGALSARIIWEHRDRQDRRYGEPTLEGA